MATNIDLYLDSGGRGLLSGGSSQAGTLPTLTRNDVYNFRLLVQNAPVGLVPTDDDLTGATIKLGIGNIDDKPTTGQFNLTLAGPVTSSAIPYNATTTQVFNAISGIAGNATVTTYGTTENAWIITAATNNTALSFGGVAGTLFPTSTVLVNTRRFPSTNVAAEQIIELRRTPAVFSDSFTAAPTSGVISLTKTQDGATTANETYRLSVGTDAVGGSFVLGFGSSSTTAIAIGSDPSLVQGALTNISAISNGNISVDGLSNGQGYSISFVRNLGLQNITTALTLDASGVYFSPWRQATVTMATAELDELFAEEGTSTITPTLEIEVSQSGVLKTICQQSVTVRKDLIVTGSAVPSPQASYYTKAEVDGGFVAISSGNVDSANRILNDSSGDDSVNWQTRKLLDGSTEYLRWDNGLGFYGNSAVAQPSGTNAINNVISTGLIANSSTYGVLPSSIKTLTTTASLNFGSFGAHDTNYQNVTITGASVNDVVLLGLPSSVCQGLVYFGHIIAANTVCIGASNTDNASINSVTQTFRVTVIGY